MKAQEFINQQLEENLHKWFQEKWVRFGPDGKIRGDCARGSEGEGKPKCLPQAQAHSLGKKGRASAAARKRRQDPNPERRGPARNVATKKKSNEGIEDQFEFELDLDQQQLYVHDQHGLPAGRVEFYNPDEKNPKKIDITMIIVQPKYQRQGLASAMHGYLKKQGYRILSPSDLTPDGEKFFGKIKQQSVAEGNDQSSAKTGIYQTDVFGAKAYHAKCMEPNCDWESRRYDRIKQAQDSAKKHAQTHIKSGVAEQVSPDFFNRPEDEPYIPPIKPVRMGDFEFDARSFIGGLGAPNAQGLQIRAYDPKKPKGDQQIGSVDFVMKTDKKGNTWLESDDTKVDEPYRGRGIAAMMYAFAKSLGNDIKASPYQSNAGKSMWGKWGKDARNLVGEQGSVNEVLNTPATGVQWDTSDPELVSANFTASNGVPYELSISASFAAPDEIGPYDFFDVDIPDDIYDASRFVEFSTKSDQPYAKGKQGIEGTGSAAEVFGIVTNALLQYTKKYKPAMLYFQAAEPSRQRLYAAIVNRMIKSLPGWAAKQQGQSNFAIYNQRLLKRQGVAEQQLDEKCWDTHRQVGMKKKGNRMVPNCVPREGVEESHESCDEHGRSYIGFTAADLTQGMAEGKKKPKQPEADYGDDYQDMVGRVKKLAGLGPLQTVYDPQKRVYKNVPRAEQPKKLDTGPKTVSESRAQRRALMAQMLNNR